MSIAKHASYNLVGSIVPLAVSLVTVPFYLRLVGLELYGVLALCWALLGYMGFLNLGLGPAVTQSMAATKESQHSEHTDIFWTAFWASLAAGMAGGLIIYGLAGLYFSRMAGLPDGLLREIADARVWLAVLTPIVLLNSVLTGTLQGHERFLSLNVITGSSSILMSIAPLGIAYLFGPELWSLLAVSLVVRILSLVAMFLVCWRSFPMRRLRRLDPTLARKLLTFGGWMTTDSVIGTMLLTFDRFVIGAMLGAAAVSIYTVPFNLVSNIQIIPQALAGVLFPRFAATVEVEASYGLEIRGISTLAVLMTPLCIGLMAAVGPFLALWLGNDLALQSAPVAYFILFAFSLNSVARIPYSRLLGSGRPDLIAKIHLIELPFYLGLLYVGIDQLGVTGAAFAWCVRTVIDAAIFLGLAGLRREAFGLMGVPMLFMVAALVASLSLPLDSMLRLLVLIPVLMGSLAWSLWKIPQSLKSQWAGAFARLPVLGKLFDG